MQLFLSVAFTTYLRPLIALRNAAVFKQGRLLHTGRQGYNFLFLDFKVVIQVSVILIGSFVSCKQLCFEATINEGINKIKKYFIHQEFPTKNAGGARKCTF